MSDTIQLNDLQKLSIHLFTCSKQMSMFSMMSGNPIGMMASQRHMELAKTILGEEVLESLSDPETRKGIIEQAHDFEELMMPRNLGLDDLFGNEDNPF